MKKLKKERELKDKKNYKKKKFLFYSNCKDLVLSRFMNNMWGGKLI